MNILILMTGPIRIKIMRLPNYSRTAGMVNVPADTKSCSIAYFSQFSTAQFILYLVTETNRYADHFFSNYS